MNQKANWTYLRKTYKVIKSRLKVFSLTDTISVVENSYLVLESVDVKRAIKMAHDKAIATHNVAVIASHNCAVCFNTSSLFKSRLPSMITNSRRSSCCCLAFRLQLGVKQGGCVLTKDKVDSLKACQGRYAYLQ